MSDQSPEHDLEHLATALETTFPTLRPVRPLSILGRGFRSMAVETGSGDVVRIGLSPDAARDYAKEWRIGPFVALHLGTVVPRPLWYAEPSAALPHGALGYRKIPGHLPPWGVDPGAAFAHDLGAFMARLHQLPVQEARAAGVPDVDAYRRVLSAREVVMPALAGRIEAAALARLELWWAGFGADDRMHTARRAVCHHDLWHENLLRSDSGRLGGVLDMAHLEVSDPAHDFGAPWYFGDRVLLDLRGAYLSAGGRFDAEDRYRAERFHEAREFGGLAWAIEHDDAAETEESVQKLLEGPILTRPSPPSA